MRKQFISLLLMVLPLFFSTIIITAVDGQKKIEGYDIIKEKMLPKCLEFKEAGSLNMLKNYDTELYLMCMEFIIDEATTNSSKTK